MKNATITLVRQYRQKETGKLIFVYSVAGTPEQLAAYKKSKGAYYREDETTKAPLYFTSRLVVNVKGEANCDLIEDSKGEFFPDTTKVDQLSNLTNQHGIDLALRLQGGHIAVQPETAE